MRYSIVLGCVATLLFHSGVAQPTPIFVCVDSISGRDAALGIGTGNCSLRNSLLQSILIDCGDHSTSPTSCLRLPGQAFSVVLAGCSSSNTTLLALQVALRRYTHFDGVHRQRYVLTAKHTPLIVAIASVSSALTARPFLVSVKG